MKTKKSSKIIAIVILVITLITLVVYLIFNFEKTWDSLVQSWQMASDVFSDPERIDSFISSFNVIVPIIGFPLVLVKEKRIRNWVCATIGETPPIKQHWYRFILPGILAVPLISYTLFSGVKETVPPVVQFSLIAVAPTLGGLVLAASGNNRISCPVREELIAITQKMIVSTVLLIVFVSLLFTVDLVGGINADSLEWSFMGFLRWLGFWGSVWTFYPGTTLFLLGISDLVLALKHLRE